MCGGVKKVDDGVGGGSNRGVPGNGCFAQNCTKTTEPTSPSGGPGEFRVRGTSKKPRNKTSGAFANFPGERKKIFKPENTDISGC